MKKILALFAALALTGCESPKVAQPEILAIGTVTGMACGTYNAGRWGGVVNGNCLVAVDVGEAKPKAYLFPDEPKGVLGKKVIIARSGETTRIAVMGELE